MSGDEGHEALVAHYAGSDLITRVRQAIRDAGLDDRVLTSEDLGPLDEFHIGGGPATLALGELLGVAPSWHLVDLGSGLGGPARRLASVYGCQVTGIDLTPAYVEVATDLTRRAGLEDRVRFATGSVVDLPFDDDAFDGAVQLHVGMNVADKPAAFAEMARVVRPGGVVGIYDVVRRGDGAVEYPVPWATEAGQSHLATVDEYVGGLEAAGFEVTVRDQHARAVATLRALAERPVAAGPLGLHLVLGRAAQAKVAHLAAAVTTGVLGPVEFIARRPGEAAEGSPR